jgi:hypothetical protein
MEVGVWTVEGKIGLTNFDKKKFRRYSDKRHNAGSFF